MKLISSNFLFLSAFFAISFLNQSLAQCELTNMTVEISDCYENENFDATIDFDFEGISALGFQVLGNGEFYGVYQYDDLPITINGLVGNCETSYEFIARDVFNPACSIFADYGEVCCEAECQIEITNVDISECEEGDTYNLSVDYEFAEVGDTVVVSVNGNIVAFIPYSNEPIVLEGLNADTEGLYEIILCDMSNPACFASYSFLNPCQCAIEGITADIIECSAEDSSYFAIIDFEYAATTDSFQMGYSQGGENNFLGVFAYSDLPVTVGPISWSDEEREILIVDKIDFFCFNSAFLGIVNDCDINCQIFNVFAESYNCENGEYFMDVEFVTEDIEGNLFHILVDDVNYGTFEYGESFYTVGPIAQNCSEAPIVVIEDAVDPLCNDFFFFDDPICCSEGCVVEILQTEVVCEEDDDIVIFVSYNAIGIEEGDELIAFFGNETFGPFKDINGTLTISFSPIANGVYPLELAISSSMECAAEALIEIECSFDPKDCTISDVFAEANDCEENSFFVDIEFDFTGAISDSFEIRGNGINYGTFAYGEAFYTVGPIESDCETVLEFVIIDQAESSCTSFFAFEEPICCDECAITDIEVRDVVCDEPLGIREFIIDFDFANNLSDSFRLSVVLGDLNNYAYADLPIKFEGNFPSELQVFIQDLDNEDCIGEFSFFGCDGMSDCVLDEGVFELIDCNKETYSLSYSMQFSETSDSFTIASPGIYMNTFAYGDLPVVLEGLPVGTELEFGIFDNEDELCSIFRSYLLEKCESSLRTSLFNDVQIINGISFINLSNLPQLDLEISLFDINGRLITKRKSAKIGTHQISTTNLSSSLYLLTISDGTTIRTEKIALIR